MENQPLYPGYGSKNEIEYAPENRVVNSISDHSCGYAEHCIDKVSHLLYFFILGK
jgi:hypothetical protein